MIRSKMDFPHAVLSKYNDDYIDSEFYLTLKKKESSNNILRFSFSYNLTSKGIRALIANRKAKVILKAESPSLYFRNVYDFSDDDHITFEIDNNLVAKHILFSAYVVATEDIQSFLLIDEHNLDYFNAPMSINRGEPLAVDNGIQLHLHEEEVNEPISSIITIKKSSDDKNDFIHMSYDRDKIVVTLDEESFDSYEELKKDPHTKSYIIGLVVFPAVLRAIQYIQQIVKNNLTDEVDYDEDFNQYIEKRWYKNIRSKLKKERMSDDTILSTTPEEIANTILRNIVGKSMRNLKGFINEQSGGESYDIMS